MNTPGEHYVNVKVIEKIEEFDDDDEIRLTSPIKAALDENGQDFAQDLIKVLKEHNLEFENTETCH